MSKNDEETVTISYNVTLARAQVMASNSSCYTLAEQEAAKVALAARKTKYDRWCDELGELRPESGDDVKSSVDDSGYIPFDPSIEWGAHAMNLLLGAPKMLDVLRRLRQIRNAPDQLRWDVEQSMIVDAIRAAVPKDVADELLKDLK